MASSSTGDREADAPREFEPPVERPGARIVRRKRVSRPRVRTADPAPSDGTEPSLSAHEDDSDRPLGGYSYESPEISVSVRPPDASSVIWILAAPVVKVAYDVSATFRRLLARLWREKWSMLFGASCASVIIIFVYYHVRKNRQVRRLESTCQALSI